MGDGMNYGPFCTADLDTALVFDSSAPQHGRREKYIRTEHAVFCVPEAVTYGVTTQEGHTGYFDIPAGTVDATVGATGVASDFRATVSVLQTVKDHEIWDSQLLEYTKKLLVTLDNGSGDVAECMTPWGVGLSGSVYLRGTNGRRDEFYIVAASGCDWLARLTAFGPCIGRTEMDLLDSILSETFVTFDEGRTVDSGWEPLSLREI